MTEDATGRIDQNANLSAAETLTPPSGTYTKAGNQKKNSCLTLHPQPTTHMVLRAYIT